MANVEIKGLTPGKSYDVQIRGRDGASYSDWSEKLTFTANADATAPSRPVAPSVVTSDVPSDNTNSLTAGFTQECLKFGTTERLEEDTFFFEIWVSGTDPGSNPDGTIGEYWDNAYVVTGTTAYSYKLVTISLKGDYVVSPNASSVYFFSRAVDRSGNKSEFSPAVTASPVTYYRNIWVGDITADKIVTGTLQANQQISVGTTTPIIIKANEAPLPLGQLYSGLGASGNANTPFYLDTDGNFTLSDTVKFTSAGASIAGWTITASSLFSGAGTSYVAIANSGLYSIWAGSATASAANFSLTNTGSITAKAGSIGGWSITTSSLSAGTTNSTVGLISNAAVGGVSIFAGSATPSSAPFYVTNTGSIVGTNLAINVGGDISMYNSGSNNSVIKFFGNSSGVQSEAQITYSDSGAAGFANALVVSKTAAITNFYMKFIPTGTGTFEIGATGGTTSGVVVIKDSIMIANDMTGSTLAGDQVQGHYLGPQYAIFRRNSTSSADPAMVLHRYNSAGALASSKSLSFYLEGADVGYIVNSTAGAPAFGGSSDYRLKTDIEDFNYASEIIKKTRLRSFKWKKTESYSVGFIAHELAESVLDLVSGTKDQMDEEGNPEYQTIIESRLLPYAVGALKEALLDIEMLKADIEELKTLISTLQTA